MEKKEKNIKDVIDAMYKKYRMNQKITEVRLKKAWADLTGPLISKHTTEIKLINKTLYVSFDNAPLKTEMMYRRFALLEAINKELGKGSIEKIFIK